ncbi:distribution and morphology protein [Anaeramoeba flamelloides]|uniref:Distribution and morphology protein n=1 Tax=Anaeramoeba flamelloides TaxID=1746091 RepID=A0ABQ8YQR7_9EUKA|nr:distribution and morphology protein [Anaeramoeba flamelloides]
MNEKQYSPDRYPSLNSWNQSILDLPTFQGVSLRLDSQLKYDKYLPKNLGTLGSVNLSSFPRYKKKGILPGFRSTISFAKMSPCPPRDLKYSHEKMKCETQKPSAFGHSLDGFLQFESCGDGDSSSPITLQTRWIQQLGSHINNDFLFIGEKDFVNTNNNGIRGNRRSKRNAKGKNKSRGNNKIAFSEILSFDFARISTQIKYTNINSIIGITNLFRIKKKVAVGFEFIVSPTLLTVLASSGVRYRTKDKEVASWLSNCGTLTTCYTSKLAKGLDVASKLELNLFTRESNSYLGFQLNTDKIWGIFQKLKKSQLRSTNEKLPPTPTPTKKNGCEQIGKQKENASFDKKSRIFDQNNGFLPLKRKNLLNFSFDMKKNWSLLLSHHFSKKISTVISVSNKNNSSWHNPEFGIQFNYIN